MSSWGKSGTTPPYRCKGTCAAGGAYCIVFGGASVDRRLTHALLRVLSPLGVQASWEAVEGLKQREHEQQPERDGRHDEGVCGHDLARVIGEEDPPRLRRWAWMPSHVHSDG